MASYSDDVDRLSTGALDSGRISPSFAQTQAEFTLSDSDDDEDAASDADLRLRAHEIGGEAYELQDRRSADRNRERRARERPDDWTPDSRTSSPSPSPVERSRRRLSASTVASFQLYTPDEEAAVVRKLDTRLVLFVSLLFLLSFLDRSNIGNARVAGMDADLQTDPPREDWYEWALTAFYIAYIVFEWMALLWRLVPAHIYVSVIVASWGLAASMQAVAPSYPWLIALRVVLGIGEAGFAGIPFYLSFFFKRQELAFRTAIFISAAPLATTFASSLAWVIIKFAQAGPIAPWRLLFLIEGFPSVVIAAVAWKVIPDSPQTVPYLTGRERKVARLRLRNEKTQHQPPPGTPSHHSSAEKAAKSSSRGIDARELLRVLIDPIAWLTAAMFFLTNMAYSSLPVFLPKILTEMGNDALTSQALAAPPYLAAFAIVLLTAQLSDRASSRALPIAIHALASAAGYGILALAGPLHLAPMVRYVAVYPAAIGFFNVVTLTIAWGINNQASESRQGGGFAVMQLIGQCGPLVGTRLYPDREAPYYARGMQACAWAMLAVAVLAVLMRFYLAYLNRRMDVAEAKSAEAGEQLAEEEEGLVGSGVRRRTVAQKFRYML